LLGRLTEIGFLLPSKLGEFENPPLIHNLSLNKKSAAPDFPVRRFQIYPFLVFRVIILKFERRGRAGVQKHYQTLCYRRVFVLYMK
jgi:hypothetical protein